MIDEILIDLENKRYYLSQQDLTDELTQLDRDVANWCGRYDEHARQLHLLLPLGIDDSVRKAERDDKLKLVDWFRSVHNATVARPEFREPESREVAERFFDEIATTVNKFAAEAAEVRA